MNKCIEWAGWRHPKGYGQLPVKIGGRWTTRRVHRLIYAGLYGEIPKNMVVMHTCDNPPCVNPAHLKLGTAKENTADMMAKGRHNPVRGSQVGTSILSETDVSRIRAMLDDGNKAVNIAKTFGVSRATIGDIKTGRRWVHV